MPSPRSDERLELCRVIMGTRLADAIAADMGVHWCVVAALADPAADRHPAIKAKLARLTEGQAGD